MLSTYQNSSLISLITHSISKSSLHKKFITFLSAKCRESDNKDPSSCELILIDED